MILLDLPLRLALALLAVAVALPCATADAIYGGYDAAASKFPAYVFLDYGRPLPLGDVGRCGGVLIAPNAVLSARHCFRGRWPKKASFRYREGGQTDFLVPRAVLHPTADVAIAFLEGQPNVRPLSLIASRPPVGRWMTAVGFGCASRPTAPKPGHESDCNKFPSQLKALPLQRTSDCGGMPSSQFCVSGGSSSLGPGDSGGPVMFQLPDGRWQVAGLVATAISYQPPYRSGITSMAELGSWVQAQLAASSAPNNPSGTPTEATPSTPATPSIPVAPTMPSAPATSPDNPQPGPVAPTEFHYSVYGTCADGACGLRMRNGPGYTNFAQVGRLSDGDPVAITCQTTGETVGPSAATGNSSAIWDRLSNGAYVSDLYVTTPAIGQFTPGIPTC
jgi:hypothetical protein